MTKDEATTVRVRVETALHALNEALSVVPAFNEGTVDEEIAESLQEAAQAVSTARAQLVNIIGF